MNEVAQQIEEYVPALQRYALALCRNASAADDLVQECVVRGLTKAHLYKPGTNLRAWLFTIMHNLHVSEIRRSGKWMLRAVKKAMMALPTQQRTVLYSVGVEGKSYEEVSEEFDIPVGTVKSRCFRARETLQKDLRDPNTTETGFSMVA